MSVKKTSSPLSSGTESLDSLGGKEDVRGGGKVEKSFESALAEVAGQLEKTSEGGQSESPARSAFQQIAQNANLDSPEDAMTAVRESARFLVNSRLKEEFRDSEQGKKVLEDLTEYISKDPFLHKKILSVLQRLK